MEYSSLFEMLVAHFARYLPLDAAEEEDLRPRLTPYELKRRQFLLHEGERCRNHHFVARGCLRVFHTDAVGKEHNLAFAEEDSWVTDLEGLYTDQPSRVSIQALEPSTLLRIQKADLLHFLEGSAKFNRVFRVQMENNYLALLDRLLASHSQSGPDRYARFLTQYPHLEGRLANIHVASFLGMTAESLSRIRQQRTIPGGKQPGTIS